MSLLFTILAKDYCCDNSRLYITAKCKYDKSVNVSFWWKTILSRSLLQTQRLFVGIFVLSLRVNTYSRINQGSTQVQGRFKQGSTKVQPRFNEGSIKVQPRLKKGWTKVKQLRPIFIFVIVWKMRQNRIWPFTVQDPFWLLSNREVIEQYQKRGPAALRAQERESDLKTCFSSVPIQSVFLW